MSERPLQPPHHHYEAPDEDEPYEVSRQREIDDEAEVARWPRLDPMKSWPFPAEERKQ